jgi:hypothetical protein
LKKYFGKFRGVVAENCDPQGIGRLKVLVPAVMGDGLPSWAMPCVPFSKQGLSSLMVPDIGSKVWVEFEEGDPQYPIWTGVWFDPME